MPLHCAGCVFGNKKNDHGPHRAVLDGVSGCGGAFAQTCEEMKPTLAFFAPNLDASEHTLMIANLAAVSGSYFDLDSAVLSVPSVYASRTLGDASSFANTSSSAGTSTPSSPAPCGARRSPRCSGSSSARCGSCAPSMCAGRYPGLPGIARASVIPSPA
ncbi:hypothetical protein FB451DRAFT_1030873 [Mycena latifolia]|nr:hypothetical protein FB451DRAFT_1030873 [Mycena latifolia]